MDSSYANAQPVFESGPLEQRTSMKTQDPHLKPATSPRGIGVAPVSSRTIQIGRWTLVRVQRLPMQDICSALSSRVPPCRQLSACEVDHAWSYSAVGVT